MALQQDQIPQSNFGSPMLAHFGEMLVLVCGTAQMLVLVCGTAQIGILNFHQKRKSNTANNYTLQCNSLQCSAMLAQRQAV